MKHFVILITGLVFSISVLAAEHAEKPRTGSARAASETIEQFSARLSRQFEHMDAQTISQILGSVFPSFQRKSDGSVTMDTAPRPVHLKIAELLKAGDHARATEELKKLRRQFRDSYAAYVASNKDDSAHNPEAASLLEQWVGELSAAANGEHVQARKKLIATAKADFEAVRFLSAQQRMLDAMNLLIEANQKADTAKLRSEGFQDL